MRHQREKKRRETQRFRHFAHSSAPDSRSESAIRSRGVGKRCMKETLSHGSTQQCLPQIPTLDRFAMRRTHPGKLAFRDRKERAFQDRFVPGEKSVNSSEKLPKSATPKVSRGGEF